MATRTSEFIGNGREKLVALTEECQKAGSVSYTNKYVDSQFGKVFVACVNADETSKPAIVMLPGFRTSGIFWDLNKTLAPLAETHRIYIVDIIGQPSLSSGTVPPVRGLEYGEWLKEVVTNLGLNKATLMGASFGNLLIFKLAQVAPHLIERAILMAPGGFTNIALRVAFSFSSTYYNMLVIMRPTKENILKFLNKLVFTPENNLNPDAYSLAIRYFEIALKEFHNAAEFPYRMADKELKALTSPVHVIVGKEDRFVDYNEVVQRSKALFSNLKSIDILENHGHGIECSPHAFAKVKEYITSKV